MSTLPSEHQRQLHSTNVLERLNKQIKRACECSGDMPSTAEWPSYNGGYDATRFSPVTAINAANVASLSEAARFTLRETLFFQAGPALVDGTS